MKKGIVLVMLFVISLLFTKETKDTFGSYGFNQVVNGKILSFKGTADYMAVNGSISLEVDASVLKKEIIVEKSEQKNLINILKTALKLMKKVKMEKKIIEKPIGSFSAMGLFIYNNDLYFDSDFFLKLTLSISGAFLDNGTYHCVVLFPIPSFTPPGNKSIVAERNALFLGEEELSSLISLLTTKLSKFKKK